MSETLGLSGIILSFIQLVILFGLQIFLCRRASKWLGLILPAFYLGKSVYMLVQALSSGLLAEYGLPGQILFAFVLPNINTAALLLVYYFNRKDTAHCSDERNELTEEQKEKGKAFLAEAGDILWNSSVLAVILLLIAGFIGGVAFLYVFNDSAQQAEAELQKDAYKGRAYCSTEGMEHDATYYVDFADLGIAPLAYSYEGRNGTDLPLTDHMEYTFSMIDTLDAPTEEFTLHYEVWDTVDPSFTGRRVNSLKKHCDGEITVPELDYGADEAYWLGDDLLLCYGKSHLILFRSDTSRDLIDSEVCADFMRNDMQLETPTWY